MIRIIRFAIWFAVLGFLLSIVAGTFAMASDNVATRILVFIAFWPSILTRGGDPQFRLFMDWNFSINIAGYAALGILVAMASELWLRKR